MHDRATGRRKKRSREKRKTRKGGDGMGWERKRSLHLAALDEGARYATRIDLQNVIDEKKQGGKNEER